MPSEQIYAGDTPWLIVGDMIEDNVGQYNSY